MLSLVLISLKKGKLYYGSSNKSSIEKIVNHGRALFESDSLHIGFTFTTNKISEGSYITVIPKDETLEEFNVRLEKVNKKGDVCGMENAYYFESIEISLDDLPEGYKNYEKDVFNYVAVYPTVGFVEIIGGSGVELPKRLKKTRCFIRCRYIRRRSG